jgi:hypothetical protein
MIKALRISKTALSHHIAFAQQFPDKTDDIRLEICIWPIIQKTGDTAWANAGLKSAR